MPKIPVSPTNHNEICDEGTNGRVLWSLKPRQADRVGPDIQLAYCWAHARRKLVEITRTGSPPIAEEGEADR
jgi:hypothetical protein